jgi:hypothetical protein
LLFPARLYSPRLFRSRSLPVILGVILLMMEVEVAPSTYISSTHQEYSSLSLSRGDPRN